MERRETKARVDAQINEWRRNIQTMKTKAEAATGEGKVEYQERVGQLEKQLDDLKVRTARALDVADDKWDSARKDIELSWDEWELRAKRAWSDLVK